MTRFPSTPQRPRTGAVADVARWISGAVVTGAVALAIFPAGVLIGAISLAPAAFVVAAIVAVGAATIWRRASLALSAVVLSLAGGVVAGAADGNTVAPRIGTLIVRPADAGDLDQRSFARGIGPVIVDLRRARFVDGRTTRVKVRADSSRIVVALPPDRCVAVRMTVVPKPRNMPLTRLSDWTSSARLGRITSEDFSRGSSFVTAPFSREDQHDASALVGQPDIDGFASTSIASSSSFLFGATAWRLAPTNPLTGMPTDAEARRTFRLVRTARSRAAPVLDLDITGPGNIIVRDFPTTFEPEQFTRSIGGPVAWPSEREFPASPEQRNAENAWPAEWSGTLSSRTLREAWASWERTAVKAMRDRARRAAGFCATDDALRTHWELVPYGGDRPDLHEFGHERLLAVNGLGELVAMPSGATFASGSAEALAAATRTRLLDDATRRARLKEYYAANIVNYR